MVTCNECGKQLKNTQGLNGHYRWAHKLNSPRSSERVPIRHAELATVGQLEELRTTVGQLEELRADTLEELELASEELRAGTASLVSVAAELRGQLLKPAPAVEQRRELAHAPRKDEAHPPGLCDSGHCAPCRASRKEHGAVVKKQVEKATWDEIDAACKRAGATATAARDVMAASVRVYSAEKKGVKVDPADLAAIEAYRLAQGAPDPEPDALTTIMAPDPDPNQRGCVTNVE